MTIDEAAERADPYWIASGLAAARASGRCVERYPGQVPATLQAAYRIQSAAIDCWPDEVRGWKVARVPPPFAVQFPEERMIGPVFARNVHWPRGGEAARCPVFAGGFAAIEAEIVIVIGADTPASAQSWTAANVVDWVGSMHIGVEVASSPLATLNDLGPGAVISDFGNNWGVVVGAEIRQWRTRERIAVETFIDDLSVGRGGVALCDAPLAALAFTMNKLAERGATLKAGDVISTGMITGVHDIRIDQHARIAFAGYGEVCLHTVRAQTLPRGG